MRLRTPTVGEWLCLLAVALLLALAVAERAPAELRTSTGGVQLITSFEGFPNGGRPYNDPAPGRHCTVGFGHLIHFGACTPADSFARWLSGQRTPGRLTRGEAMALLSQRLAQRYEPAVRALFRPPAPLAGAFNQHRFDALTSLTFNLGPGAVQCVGPGFETLCRAIGSRSPRAVADALLRYDHAGGVRLPGLTRRRHAERALMLRPMGRFELFPARERRWIVEHDRRSTTPARRRQLERAMGALAVRIERTARADHPDGWRIRRRKTRHAALERRSHERRTNVRAARLATTADRPTG